MYRCGMVIPFYGVDNREMFEIEREAMDRPGKVVEALNAILPDEGVVLDIGAGDGFTGQRLAVLLLESSRIRDRHRRDGVRVQFDG